MLQEKLAKDLHDALRARDTVRVSTLRLLIAAIRNKEIERKKTCADGDVLEVIQAEAKGRREAIEQYQTGNRADLVQKEEAELAVLQAYLPKALTEAELHEKVAETIKSVGPKGPQDIGKVMAALMPQIKGRADGKQAQQLVQQLLKP